MWGGRWVKGRPLYIVRDSEGFSLSQARHGTVPSPHWARPGPTRAGAWKEETSSNDVAL